MLAVIATVTFMSTSHVLAATNGKYKVGDRVECDPAQIGQFKKGTVAPYLKNDLDQESGRYYRVVLDGSYITEGYECMATHMRPLAEAAPPAAESPKTSPPANNSVNPVPVAPPVVAPVADPKPAATPTKAASLKPKLVGGLPVLAGTAWKIDWGIKGSNVQNFLFCTTGRWEVVSSQLLNGALTMMGTYRVQGKSLLARDANDGKTTTYKMTWKGGMLELNDGKSKMKLYEPVKTLCR